VVTGFAEFGNFRPLEPDAINIVYLKVLDKPVLVKLVVYINLLIPSALQKMAVEFLVSPCISTFQLITTADLLFTFK
jgi:hypothetical protein